MLKGIVMDLNDKFIIVMRPDGKFDRVPRRNRTCTIGEEVEYPPQGYAWLNKTLAVRSVIAAAAVFVLVLFAGLQGRLGGPEIAAYISMDINPSVELGIDAEEKVLELRGLNEDGMRLIEAVSYKGLEVGRVTAALLDKASPNTLVDGTAEIVIASVVVDKGKGKLDDQTIAEKIHQQVTEHIKLTHPEEAEAYHVSSFAAPAEAREAAMQNEVSVGKYSIYLTAKSKGAQLSLEEIKSTSVTKLVEEKPDIAELIVPENPPSKEQIRQWAADERNGQLGKWASEPQKEPGNGNGNGNLPPEASGNGNNGENGSKGKGKGQGQSNQPDNAHGGNKKDDHSKNKGRSNKEGKDDDEDDQHRFQPVGALYPYSAARNGQPTLAGSFFPGPDWLNPGNERNGRQQTGKQNNGNADGKGKGAEKQGTDRKNDEEKKAGERKTEQEFKQAANRKNGDNRDNKKETESKKQAEKSQEAKGKSDDEKKAAGSNQTSENRRGASGKTDEDSQSAGQGKGSENRGEAGQKAGEDKKKAEQQAKQDEKRNGNEKNDKNDKNDKNNKNNKNDNKNDNKNENKNDNKNNNKNDKNEQSEKPGKENNRKSGKEVIQS